MVLYTVTTKLPRDARWREAASTESKFDAERCVTALRNRFQVAQFHVAAGARTGCWDIRSGPGFKPADYEIFKAFAEGFMASSYLWER